MASDVADTIDAFLADARLSATRAVLAAWVAQAAPQGVARRFAAGIYAAVGSERGVAAAAEPELFVCDGAALERHLGALREAAKWYDFLAAGVAASWCGNAQATLHWLDQARDAALADGHFPVAVAACERLGHHALLFGNVTAARQAIDQGLTLAAVHRLGNWRLRCAAAGARLAFDTGDPKRAAELLSEARTPSASTELRALFAATGVQLAAAAHDQAALQTWTSPEMLDVALCSDDARSSGAAAIALLLVSGTPAPGSPVSVALRRALLQAEDASGAVELHSSAARYGAPDEARFGVDALNAVFAPHRAYLEAHALLARAHWCFRFGERSDAIDSAGDAARAFDAIGLRRWTEDSMQLLVHQEGGSEMHRRRRPTAFSLTGREQQVAHLIRRGASNREVARTLQISEHTVERHVSSILSRLGLRSRWQIVDAPNNANNEH